MQQGIRHDTLWRLFQWLKKMVTYIWAMGFAGGSDSKESTCNVGDLDLTPGGAHGNPFQYSCLENPHGKRRLEHSSLWGCRVCHDWATKHNTVQTKDWASKGVQVVKFSSVQFSLPIWLFATPQTAAHQASLSIPNSWGLLKLRSTESVMPSNHLILCRPLLLPPSIFPSSKVFSNGSILHIRCQSIGVSASVSVFPVNTQNWFPLGWTGWISLQSKGLSRVFSNTTVQKHQFFSAQLSL